MFYIQFKKNIFIEKMSESLISSFLVSDVSVSIFPFFSIFSVQCVSISLLFYFLCPVCLTYIGVPSTLLHIQWTRTTQYTWINILICISHIKVFFFHIHVHYTLYIIHYTIQYCIVFVQSNITKFLSSYL